MATGTGKTSIVFQIIWRLWKAGKVRRVLFLVDRNSLADQTMTNDFKPFGPVMTKVRDRNMDPGYEVYYPGHGPCSAGAPNRSFIRHQGLARHADVQFDRCGNRQR